MVGRIYTNVPSLFARRNLEVTNGRMMKTLERLSSGLRINHAGDGAAELAIADRLRTQVRGLNQAKRNAQDGLSLIQTAEGGLAQISEMLQRMRQLAIQASNDTYTTSDRRLIQTEINELVSEIDRMASTATFNQKRLLTGDYATTSLVFQVGANQNETVGVTIATTSAAGLGTATGKVSNFNVTDALTTTNTAQGFLSRAGAESAIAVIDAAITDFHELQASIGAMSNRLQHSINFIGVAVENASAAESRIRDADIAEEVANLTREQILIQTGTAAVAQANTSPQLILALLQ